ncbi:hypothetical protein OH146_09745 [Salinibacterium sp. SYSU T00001]|uniref:hypothetical protein n=1 Tax=Homoserinimonas sedimenticola TaxID=2986805 RepID=UPI002235F23C|nr:hypothetical protein [Salinibacterium sedimenticola]MCW4386054.1 hypothetical protein [Salinibacterium sedimenticola]
MSDTNSDSGITSGKRGGSDGASNDDKPDFALRDMEHSEAPIDQVGEQRESTGQRQDEEQNPPLPDWGPTDGEHGTDQDPELTDE